MNQRQPPIVSKALRASAGHHDARCMLNTDACDPNGGCVLCHVRFNSTGAGIKPDDFCASFGCVACHDLLDGRRKGLEHGSGDWYFYALRGVIRTQRWWFDHGFLTIGDSHAQ